MICSAYPPFHDETPFSLSLLGFILLICYFLVHLSTIVVFFFCWRRASLQENLEETQIQKIEQSKLQHFKLLADVASTNQFDSSRPMWKREIDGALTFSILSATQFKSRGMHFICTLEHWQISCRISIICSLTLHDTTESSF